jgi:hypothetical protein
MRFSLIVGDTALLSGVKYVITLDTRYAIAARRGTAVHRHHGAPVEPSAL